MCFLHITGAIYFRTMVLLFSLQNYLIKYSYGPVVHDNLFDSWIEVNYICLFVLCLWQCFTISLVSATSLSADVVQVKFIKH